MERHQSVALFVFGEPMTSTTIKQFKKLEKRVAALEEILGEVSVPSVESVITLSSAYGYDLAKLLQENGFSTVEQVAVASDDELRSIKGIGPALLNQIRAAG
jgi:predicted flap endonuclease-1-like 5' DNA nuclease